MFLEVLMPLLDEPKISDIHLDSEGQIWTRSSGELVKSDQKVSSEGLMSWLGARYKDTTPMAEILSLGGQDDFAINLGRLRIRCHAWVSSNRVQVSLRRLATKIPPLRSLGLPTTIEKMLSAEQGLILVTGPTSSGKTTTMAAMIDELNTNTASHILTLEDPIEYLHHDKKSRIRQRQVSARGDGDCTSFSAGVIASMREDPDIILVGEMRDFATVHAALTAAQTGHLVFGSLHTNGGMETINRLLSFYDGTDRELARSVLSAVLNFVISQRLLKTKTGDRVLAAELLINTTAVRTQIAQDKVNLIQQELNTGSSSGQLSMNRTLASLVREGQISRDVALNASPDRISLESELS